MIAWIKKLFKKIPIQCENCRYWYTLCEGDKWGECRKRVPKVVTTFDAQGKPMYPYKFPQLHATAWCGEFKLQKLGDMDE